MLEKSETLLGAIFYVFASYCLLVFGMHFSTFSKTGNTTQKRGTVACNYATLILFRCVELISK